MQAIDILDTVSAAGGQIWLDGDKVRVRLPESLMPLVAAIRELKPQLIELLAQRLVGITKNDTSIMVPPEDNVAAWFVNGARVTVFPHCPRCASYALYRKDNLGDYECQTCGLLDIEESTARRVQ